MSIEYHQCSEELLKSLGFGKRSLGFENVELSSVGLWVKEDRSSFLIKKATHHSTYPIATYILFVHGKRILIRLNESPDVSEYLLKVEPCGMDESAASSLVREYFDSMPK